MSNYASYNVTQEEQPQFDPNQPNHKYLKGEKPSDCAFKDQQEMIDAMTSEHYESSAEYRAIVAVMVANSEFGGVTHNQQEITTNEDKAAKRKADWQAQEDAAILREHAQKLFDDPRYETDTLYRRQVREQVAQNEAMIEKVLPGTKAPTKLNMRVSFTGSDYEEVKAGLAKQAADQRKKDAAEAAKAAERQASERYVDVLGSPGAEEDDSE